MPEKYRNMPDHDLLVEVATMIESIQGTQKDHEKRLRFLERYVLPIGMIGIYVINYILTHASIVSNH